MKSLNSFLKFAAVMFVLGLFAGCESTEGGGSVSGGVYYGAGLYDPYYYGGYYDHDDIVVTPPGNRPNWGAHPEQPIARPPTASTRPMPSIPSTPRPMPRGGGGRR